MLIYIPQIKSAFYFISLYFDIFIHFIRRHKIYFVSVYLIYVMVILAFGLRLPWFFYGPSIEHSSVQRPENTRFLLFMPSSSSRRFTVTRCPAAAR